MLVKVDAAFEAVLGVVLLGGAVSGALDGSDFPHPVGTVVLVAAGAALLLLAAAIWRGRVGMRALVLGNAVSAVAGLGWLAAASGWSTLGAALVAAVVACLAALAAGQAATLRA